MRQSINAARLRSLFRPRSVALVGASEKSAFSHIAFTNLMQFGFGDHTYLVNPRTPSVHGRSTVQRLADIDEPVDVAYLMVPQSVTLEALREAANAGVRNAVVLSSGYGESGAAGRLAEAELVAFADDHDMLILGPNHLGFANFVDQIPVASIPGLPRRSGPIALLSQSGASSSAMLDFATASGNDLSYLVTLGNEAMITAGHALDFFVHDESTRAIAIFMETIREPEVFKRAALAALHAGKAVVALKAGTSELAARTAAAHTGALVGDDRSVDAMFRDLGIIRVDTIEDMIITAGLAAHTGPLGPGGMGVVSISGGACDIVADRAQDARLPLPALNELTTDRLGEVMPEYGTVQNPLDVTGAAMIRPAMFTDAVAAVAGDDSVAVVTVIAGAPWVGEGRYAGQAMLNAIGVGIDKSSTPAILVSQVSQPVTAYTRQVLDEAGIGYLINGLGQSVTAVAGVVRWSQRRRQVLAGETAAAVRPLTDLPAVPEGTWSEYSSRLLLTGAGVPVVPGVLARDEGEAVAAAAEFGGPVVLKIVSADIAHKSDIGGVRLGVTGAEAVREAFRSVAAAGVSIQGARIEGVLVSPMRAGGLELLVGAVRDPQWGPMLAIGLGGIFVEILGDTVLTAVPVTPNRIKELLATLKAAPLFGGYRGGQAVDLDHLATVISSIGDVVAGLGDRLEALEINPLRVDGGGIEALDALVSWKAPSIA